MKPSKREQVAIVFAEMGDEANDRRPEELAKELDVSESTVAYVRRLYNKTDELPEQIPSRVNW